MTRLPLTFKQYYLAEASRRDFLKSMFGGAAAVAVANPAQAATAVAKAASAPWIKVSLEADFMIYDYSQVSPEVIGKISKAGGKFAPGLSKSGDIMIDYNDSATDMMEVYVKPGTSTYKEVFARTDDDSDEEPNWEAFDFEKQVFDTIADPDGDGAGWLEQQLENEADDYFFKYEKQPDDWKDEIATVDGIEPDHYEAVAQKDAADNIRRFIDQAGDIGTEVPEHLRDVVGRGYMKAHVLANGSGSESISNDTMQELRELYDNEDIDYPDEMDSDRWLDGSADNPMDSMAYDSDEYQQDMDQVTGGEDQNDVEDWITAGFNFLMGASQKQESVPVRNLLNVPGFYDALKKGRAINGSKYNMSGPPDMSEPLQITHDGREPIEIIGGFEQLAAADADKIAIPRVQMIHVDELPGQDPRELYREPESEDTSRYMDNENV